MMRIVLMVGILLLVLAQSASAQLKKVPCEWLGAISGALNSMGPPLCVLMFVYGGLKYTFSADDPGGRKQGKMICINAIIGYVIVLLAGSLGGIALAPGAIC